MASSVLAAMLVAATVAAVAAAPHTTASLITHPVSDSDMARLYADMKHAHSKAYSAEEDEKRFAIFKDNVKYIADRNAQYLAGDIKFYLGVNQFTDMTNDEFKRTMLRPYKRTRKTNYVDLPRSNVTAIDWRKHNAVTPVKNQGQCGSCWSFSTTGSVEGAWAIKFGKLVSLSEQQLMDCSGAEGNMGCNGGLMDQAFEYIIKNGGLDTEADYPYLGADEFCNDFKTANQEAWIDAYNDVPKNSEDALQAAASIGPVSVAIEADQSDFQSYSGGIFNADCGDQLDHGVLVVGFNTTKMDKDGYWIVKNSWGDAWGMDGYILMQRNIGGNTGICGILSSASYPVITNSTKPPHPRPTFEYYYGDPNIGTCHEHEIAYNFSAPLTGRSCIAPCRGLFRHGCQEEKPPGTEARAECVLTLEGSQHPDYCALVCNPDSKKTNNGCPDHASCKPVNGTHVCTYDS